MWVRFVPTATALLEPIQVRTGLKTGDHVFVLKQVLSFVCENCNLMYLQVLLLTFIGSKWLTASSVKAPFLTAVYLTEFMFWCDTNKPIFSFHLCKSSLSVLLEPAASKSFRLHLSAMTEDWSHLERQKQIKEVKISFVCTLFTTLLLSKEMKMNSRVLLSQCWEVSLTCSRSSVTWYLCLWRCKYTILAEGQGRALRICTFIRHVIFNGHFILTVHSNACLGANTRSWLIG